MAADASRPVPLTAYVWERPAASAADASRESPERARAPAAASAIANAASFEEATSAKRARAENATPSPAENPLPPSCRIAASLMATGKDGERVSEAAYRVRSFVREASGSCASASFSKSVSPVVRSRTMALRAMRDTFAKGSGGSTGAAGPSMSGGADGMKNVNAARTSALRIRATAACRLPRLSSARILRLGSMFSFFLRGRCRSSRKFGVARQVFRMRDAKVRKRVRRRPVAEPPLVGRVFRPVDKAAKEEGAHGLRRIHPAYPVDLASCRAIAVEDDGKGLESRLSEVARKLALAELLHEVGRLGAGTKLKGVFGFDENEPPTRELLSKPFGGGSELLFRNAENPGEPLLGKRLAG